MQEDVCVVGSQISNNMVESLFTAVVNILGKMGMKRVKNDVIFLRI